MVKSVQDKVRKVTKLIRLAGNRIGSVRFVKRSDGTRRRMSYRLHVEEPTYASQPTGKRFRNNKIKDRKNRQMTVFDVNKINYNHKGRMNGRGNWRTIPLENVTRVAVNGEIYKVIEVV
jgi:hypothetical protein